MEACMKKIISILLFVLLTASFLIAVSACTVIYKSEPLPDREKYTGPYSEVNGAFAGTDDLDRELTTDNLTYAENEKTVGIFYFLWQGEHGTAGPYDNNKIVQQYPYAVNSEKLWMASGGGAIGAHHFWGEPLFGYYTSSDKWVLRKHAQMLIDAGVDYIVIDTTNAFPYTARVKDLISVWYEFYEQGFDVPKISFYTNSSAAETMTTLYNEIYANSSLYVQYPNLKDLWFYWDGKPLIIGTNTGISSSIQNYFTIKLSQWPNEGKKPNNSWPWMEFSRSLTNDSVYYDQNGEKMVINVSIAQHSDTVNFSYTAWYNGNDRTRSWHDGANDTDPNAVLYGYNFAEQWEFALKQDTPTIFITGWNEWVAQRQPGQRWPIRFVDCADPNNSRDAEPMRGLFGDNYYMQMADYIRQYKGVSARVDVGQPITIDISGDFDQWNNPAITAVYTDYNNDTGIRFTTAFGNQLVQNKTGRNNFVTMKTAHDAENLYFYVQTQNNITAATDSNWMTLFLKTEENAPSNWYGYDYAVNLQGKGVLSRCTGGWNWEPIGNIDLTVDGNQMMLCIPYQQIGLDRYTDGLVDLEFKWADNYQENEDGQYDIFTFYTDGDAAPMGRMNYVYSDVK